MDLITPAVVMSASDVLNGSKCDGIELTTNLFKDHKMSIDDQKSQRLETYLRIRSLPNYDSKDMNTCFQVIDNKNLLVIPPKGSNANKFGSDSDQKNFTFSKIFNERVDQLSVYESFGLPVVKQFLEGKNGLLFAYGITSSGKSYTMRGTTANPGVIPRALNTVFDVIGLKMEKEVPILKPNTFTECCFLSESDRDLEEGVRKFVFENTDKNYEILMNSFRSQISLINENTNQSILWNDVLHSTFRTDESNIRCSVWITFCEIYNEMVYDLLDLEVGGEKKQKILLLKDKSDNYYVKGLRQICVSTPEEAYKVLLFGQNNLHISSTNLNKNSSRSHCAFNITLVSTYTNARTRRSEYNINHLSICDLAGAERSEKANNTGERIREAGKINGSLLSLSRCISTIRHNQKFEHEPSKKRFVNFRDSKLTKVFQPFLSGCGTAAMISNMNPSPNLFDETLFALKFAGVAAQVVVSTEVQRNKFHDSLRRLTQLWMQSSERWSNFAHLKPPKSSVSIIQTIAEEDEDESEGDNDCLDVTVEEFERKIDEMTHILNKSTADPQEMELLKTQIDFLVEKLKQTENDKFEMELEVRRQVVSEFNKLIKDMEDMAEDKDKAKKNLEIMMTQRLVNNENIYKKEKLDLESKMTSIETEIFELREELCRIREEKDRAVTEVELINRVLSDKEDVIKELESRVIQFNNKSLENESKQKCLKDMNTSPIKVDLRDANTSTLYVDLKDANNSAINLLDMKDANTSAVVIEPNIECMDKSVQNSIIEMKETETSIEGLTKMSDKMTFASIESHNKSTSIETNGLLGFEDKETTTECLSPSDTTIRAEECNPKTTISSKHVSTSPIVFKESEKTSNSTSPQKCLNDSFVSKDLYNELMDKTNRYETEIKQKDAMIAFNRKIVVQRDQRLKLIEEENNKLIEKIKTNAEMNFEQLFKPSIPLKVSSTTCSTTSSKSSFTSKSIKSEDLMSISSNDSVNDKPKKSSKYSQRKRKQNPNNSIDKRYLISVKDTNDTVIENKSSQTSVNSTESCGDEIGEDVYSTKKRSIRRTTKRKPNNNSLENENFKDINKGPESKRKRPPLKNLFCSPISPIPTGKVMTRSKAKKCIQF